MQPSSGRRRIISSLKTWKMRLIHNMVDDYVSRVSWCQQHCELAVNKLSVERVFTDNRVPGHALVRFSGRYIESCFGCSACKVYLCRTGCFVAFHRDMY